MSVWGGVGAVGGSGCIMDMWGVGYHVVCQLAGGVGGAMGAVLVWESAHNKERELCKQCRQVGGAGSSWGGSAIVAVRGVMRRGSACAGLVAWWVIQAKCR